MDIQPTAVDSSTPRAIEMLPCQPVFHIKSEPTSDDEESQNTRDSRPSRVKKVNIWERLDELGKLSGMELSRPSGSKRTVNYKDIRNNNVRVNGVSDDITATAEVMGVVEDEITNHVDMEDLFGEYTCGTSLKSFKSRVASLTSIQNMELNGERSEVEKDVELLMSELVEECSSEVSKMKVKSTPRQYNRSSVGNKYSLSTCCFCEFTHSNTLFVITHEVVHHHQELLSVINQPEIYTRYYHKTFNKTLVCSLCYCKVASTSPTHLLSHANKSRIYCSVCTFSSNSVTSLRCHSVAHSRQKDKHVHSLKEALDYVRSEDGIGRISLTITVGSSTNRKQSRNLKRPRSNNGTNSHNKVIKVESNGNDKPTSGSSGIFTDDANEIRTKCLYCVFTHTSELYTLTHEIISHRDEVKGRFENVKTETDTLMRYCFRSRRGNLGGCRLCGTGTFRDRVNHVKSHLIAQTHECEYCTYSKEEKFYLKFHDKCHNTSTERKMKYLEAKKYARGGVGCAAAQSDSTTNVNNDLDLLASANNDDFVKRNCLYCNFSHRSDVVTYTHEVLVHTNKIRDQGFSKDVRARYIVSTKGSSMCYLCGCNFYSLYGSNMKKHLLGHLVSGSNLSKKECDYCTFAHEERYPIKHVLMHDKEGESYMNKEMFLAAKQYVRGENVNDDNVGVELGKVLIKVKKEMKQAEGEKFAKAPSKKTSTPKPEDNNISSYKCNYCNFTHTNQVFILTHEVFLHGRLICSSLSSPNHSDILTRFSGYWPDAVGFLVCLLCGSPRAKDDKSFTIHLKHHGYPQYANQCKTCTYSNQRSDHLNLHESIHVSEDDSIKANIRELTDAIGFVIGYSENAHTDADQPSTSTAPYPQQPYINKTEEHNDGDIQSSVKKDKSKREHKSKKGRKSREGDKESCKASEEEDSAPNYQLPPGCPKPSVIYILNCPTSPCNNNTPADPQVIFLSPTSTSCCCRHSHTTCGGKTGSGENGRGKMMECPICDFMCNDQKVILQHISSTHSHLD